MKLYRRKNRLHTGCPEHPCYLCRKRRTKTCMCFSAYQWSSGLCGYRSAAGLRIPKLPEYHDPLPQFRADTNFLYPSIYFGEPCTVDNLRKGCSATIPAGATAEQIQTVPALADGAITRTYLYNQYQIRQNPGPDTAIRKLLTPVSEHSAKANASESDITEKTNLPNMEKATSLFKKIPIYIYLLVLLLIVVVIMEIILLRKSRNEKKGKSTDENTI